MKTAKVTYNAPAGDSKVVEMGGVTFFDGQAVEINSEDNAHLMMKLPGNRHFTVEAGEEKSKGGRAPKPDKAASDKPPAADAPAVPPVVSPVQ